MGYGYLSPWFGFLPPPLGMLISIFVLIFVFVWLMRLIPGGRHRHRGRGALYLLDERFARGDIDRAEYEERRKILSRS